VFVCENNGYAEFSALEDQTKVTRVAEHGERYGIPSETIDGNDVLEVRDAVARAVARAREDAGPTFLECKTYRLRGHYEGDPGKYRELSERDDWKAKDPIARLTAALGDEAAAAAAEREARQAVEEAATWALGAPWPDKEELMTNVVPV
jgi:pyruvate dehydrogenase E1 component alpha subunit